ncbi:MULTISPECIES: glycosyltransferase [Ramlibacter]|uniref:Glycosyltransferase n=1 Tax=Ramlibacter pinisoli TaxID=2682844 RepID=A0A6N8ISI1_9BURK|nr:MULTISPECIES: glycosyltransferase [Ramlibacter]MVQ29797.1 glycosyltransferase [Ramlibacter pinisoli]
MPESDAAALSTKPFDLTLVADGDIATARIVEMMFREGGDAGRVSLRIDGVAALKWSRPARGGKLLLIRTGAADGIEPLSRMVAAGVPYAYYIDDNFWLLLGSSPLDLFYQHNLVRRALEIAISGARVVICHSEAFRSVLLGFNRNVVVIPPHFDFSLLSDVPDDDPGELRIGVVGNVSRASDIAFLVDVVRQVQDRAEKQPVFEFFGYTPPELERVAGVRSLPAIRDYREFIREQQSRRWLLALAPLADTPFAAYKTNNKFREFGACGIAGIYSDTPVYRASVEHGRTGWVLPHDSATWAAQILQSINDPAATRAIGAAAVEVVRRIHDAPNVHAAWRKTLVSALSETSKERARRIWQTWRVRYWDCFPVRQQLILTAAGPNSSSLPGERHGYWRRPVLFHVPAGSSIECWWRPPCAGDAAFSMVVATYTRALTGQLVLAIEQDGSADHWTCDLREIKDGQVVNVRTKPISTDPARLRLTNKGSGDIALYACSRLSTTLYPESGRQFPFGFVV